MKLIDCTEPVLCRGTVFRFKGKYPFCEDHVDFMLCNYPHCGDDCIPFAIYCVSGYCAGHIEYVLPLEAQYENSRSVSTEWVIKNWNRCIYADCAVSDVEVIL